MMRPAEFEEREYEAPLYNQLERGLSNLWAPGQVLEGTVGFDRGFFIADFAVWRLLGYDHVLGGSALGRIPWPSHWGPKTPGRKLPTFRLNLFLQVKRSQFSKSAPNAASSKGLRGATWGFFIDPNQQSLLEILAAKTTRRAHVSYAAPVFHTVRDLWRHTRGRSVVDHSTFPEVLTLKGHRAWYYQKPGANGVANPDAEFVQAPPLEQRLRALEELPVETENGDTALQTLAEAILDATSAAELRESFLRARFFDELLVVDRLAEQERLPANVKAYMQVALFIDIFKLVWFVVG